MHARLSEYRKERGEGARRLHTHGGRARIFHKLKGSGRFAELNSSTNLKALRGRVRRRFQCVRTWNAPAGLEGLRVRNLPRAGHPSPGEQWTVGMAATMAGQGDGSRWNRISLPQAEELQPCCLKWRMCDGEWEVLEAKGVIVTQTL